MPYNSVQKLRDNLAAIRIALEWKEGNVLSQDEVAALQRYSGFGGLKAILYPAGPIEEWRKLNASKEDLRLHPQMMELHRLLKQFCSEDEYKAFVDSLRNSVLTAFYTPPVVPQTLFAVLKEQDIELQNLYEPSSGAGVFVSEAAAVFPSLKQVVAVEKDELTGRVLTALTGSMPVSVSVQVKGFEETSNDENGKFDLIISNIPFGNFRIRDDSIADRSITDKIHNYFFAKGLQKIKEGGLLTYITTDAFLNSPSNKGARKYLFQRADFISLNVLPDNLMKDTGNTQPPSHLLIVQKNEGKQALSNLDQELINTVEQTNNFGPFHCNQYIASHPEILLGDLIRPGKDQYGKAHQVVWQRDDINDISVALSSTIRTGIQQRFNHKAFTQRQQLQESAPKPHSSS